jgi:abortive infection bacteriophage resistance protein
VHESAFFFLWIEFHTSSHIFRWPIKFACFKPGEWLFPIQRKPKTAFAGSATTLVVGLYVFDKRLRLLFLDAIERIEVGLRVDIALLLGLRGAFAHRDIPEFNGYFSRVDPDSGDTLHAKFLNKLDTSYQRSREEFAEHFRKKTQQGATPLKDVVRKKLRWACRC